MTVIRLTYPLVLACLTGKVEETILVQPGSTIEELLEALANRYGDEFKTPLFKDDGQLRKTVDIRINGKAFDEHRKLYGQYLSANDVISFAKACC